MMAELDDILDKTWKKVRKDHLFPELPTPKCTEGEERVGLDIKGKKISISSKFVEEMSEVLDPAEVLEGLLDHAVSHYLYCPWDFSTHLKLYAEAKKIFKDKEKSQKATDYFMDVVADTHCISQKDTPIPSIYRHLKRGILDQAVHALYQKIWGMDLGVDGYEDVARKLSRLPYLDRNRWPETIKRFARMIHTILEEQEEQGEQGDSDAPSAMDDHNLQQYSEQEIEQGLKDLAQTSANPSEFKEIVNDFEEELTEAMAESSQAMGLGPGVSSPNATPCRERVYFDR
ncbi:hypothetical protein ACFL9T_15805, partial [Thermodesulfobacteriota bacterium]